MAGKLMVLSLLAFVASCSADAAHESDGVRGAPSVPGSAAVSAGGVATATPAATEAADVAMGATCAAGETVLFSCDTTKGKRVALCASRDVGDDHGYLYYVFGAPGHPELLFPENKRPPIDFKRTQLSFAGSTGGYAYSFENQGYRYIVYSVSGAEGLEDQGVLVTRGEARNAVSSLSCLKGSVREDDDTALLDLTFTWRADADLEQHGLPTRK